VRVKRGKCRGGRDAVSPEALSTAIGDRISNSEGKGANEELEPPTLTLNSVEFSTFQPTQPDNAVPSNVKGSPPVSTGHASDASIASVISKVCGTKASRPTTRQTARIWRQVRFSFSSRLTEQRYCSWRFKNADPQIKSPHLRLSSQRQ
jgi:hypothetical protein